MPLYEFICNRCQHRFEKMLAVQERESICCPNCAAIEVKQAFSPFFTAASKMPAPSTTPCHQCNASCAHAKG